MRAQALDSLQKKRFHCEGGGVYGLLAMDRFHDLLRFIIAYQTICDYLDNLCDKSDALDPNDFRSLHNALIDALTPGAEFKNYYQYRQEQEDGGYLHALISTCQEILHTFPSFALVQKDMIELSGYYGDLQVYKHVQKEDREPLLKEWFEKHKHKVPEMTWFEFSASTASTLGIYSLATYSTKANLSPDVAQTIKTGYFPWVQGMHILLDYFIDQEEDWADDELNFIDYYASDQQMIERFQFFETSAEENIQKLPHPKFHRLLIKGIISLYLADEKIQTNKVLKKKSRKMIKHGGISTLFFYLNSWMYRRNDKDKQAK